MQNRDLPAIMELERELFGPEAWSPSMMREELASDARRYVVVLPDGGPGEVVGYAGLALYDIEAHILTVGVRQEHRRRGVARLMVRHLLDLADAHGVERVLLEVRADDEGAQALYAAEGFEPIGIRRKYYAATGTDAVVMARS